MTENKDTMMIKHYYLCTSCGTCREKCTILRNDLLESFSPRSRVTIAGDLFLNKLGITQRVKDVIFSCTLCGLCHNSCPSGVDVMETVKATRRYILEKGAGPESLKALINSLMDEKNIFMLDNSDRMDWAADIEEDVKNKIKKQAETAIYVGCQESFKGSLYNIPEALVLIFNRLNYDYTLLGEDEWCCGAPFFLLGLKDEKSKQLMVHNVEAMKSLGVKKIITTCPGCYKAWNEEYRKMDKELPFEIKHSTEILADFIKDNTLKITKPFKAKVVFQDPCELGRHSGIYEAPRIILKNIPELELIELEREKADAYCCGGGGLCKATYPDTAAEIAGSVVDKYIDAGAEVIVTSCPACFDNLVGAIEGKDVKLIDIHDLVFSLLN
ncbi:MAG: (Fe-S)-binding protein [Candidatus Helarchaeota archaeon]